MVKATEGLVQRIANRSLADIGTLVFAIFLWC